MSFRIVLACVLLLPFSTSATENTRCMDITGLAPEEIPKDHWTATCGLPCWIDQSYMGKQCVANPDGTIRCVELGTESVDTTGKANPLLREIME